MTAEVWEQVKVSFERAATLCGTERGVYLKQLSEADKVVHKAVTDLLTAHDDASQFLETFTIAQEWVFKAGELVGDRFRVIRRLRRGGMGEVYEVFDEKLHERRALKTMRSQFAADPEALQRFHREIRIAQRVAHDNLCRVYDLIEHHRTTDTG